MLSSSPLERVPAHAGAPAPRRATAATRATVALFALASFFALYAARQFFLPLVFAGVFSLLMRPVVRRLKSWHIPESVTALAIVVALIFGAVWGVVSVYDPAVAWAKRAPESFRSINGKLEKLRQPVVQVNEAAAAVEKIASTDSAQSRAIEVKRPGWRDALFDQTLDALSTTVVMVFLLFFLLATGGRLLDKITQLVSRTASGRANPNFARDLEQAISRYLGTVSLINACLGTALGLAMWAIGMPNPVLWGVMAALLTFIPYLGAVTGVTLLALAAMMTFDDLRWIAAPAIYAGLACIEGMLVTPAILGRRFEVDPVVVFLWLVFWGWIWGIPGALLAMPMLAVVKIVAERVEGLKVLDDLLGRGRKLSTPRKRA